MSNHFAKKTHIYSKRWFLVRISSTETGCDRQIDVQTKQFLRPSVKVWSCSDPKMYWRRIAGISRIISRVLRLVRTSKHGDVYQSTTIDNLLVSDGGTQGDHCTKKSGVIFNHPENSAVFYHVVAKLNSQLQILLSIKISGITIAPNRSLKNHT